MPRASRKTTSKAPDRAESSSLGKIEDKSNDELADKVSPSSPSIAAKSSSKVEPETSKSNDSSENDSYDVVLPPLLGTTNGGECTLMVEVGPDDASLLDYEGMSGAIGRFEANHHGVIVDLKGNRYQGSILPGPTVLVVNLMKGGQFKVESITDEFATLAKTQDVMKSLDAVVKGEYDEGFQVREENVNKTSKQGTGTVTGNTDDAKTTTTPKTKKRANSTSAKGSAKRKKK